MPGPSSLARGHGFFVTGTDTAVGKTLVTCALLHAYAAQGQRAIGMKPVAAGAVEGPDGLLNEDVSQILAASNVAAPRSLVNPYCFRLPVAPHIAARDAGVDIDLHRIQRAYDELVMLGDKVIVEGVGGVCVPLSETEDTMDLALRLKLPMLLVVGMRLGCLNHALLTASVIRACGLTLAGWVANHIDPTMPYAEANVVALTKRLRARLVARIEYLQTPDWRYVAPILDIDGLAGVR